MKNNTIGLISKKSDFESAGHFFFVHFFAVVLHNYNVKLQKLLKLHVLRRKCCSCSRSLFFSLPLITLHMVATSISHFVTATANFSCCSSNKKMSPLFFISRSRPLSPFFSLSFAGLPPTFSSSQTIWLLETRHATYNYICD